ncbi:MAG: 2OG-Fe(II) oxygenase [Pacificimonas sp.]|nr:2OG-Fe(II) oxygenase [Pacificimonas sp.]
MRFNYQPRTPVSEQKSEARAEIGRKVWARLKAVEGIRIVEQRKAQVAVINDFLDADTCAQLCTRIDASNQRSSAYTDSGIDDKRTSHSSNFRRDEPFIRDIELKMCDLLGLPEESGETMQGQRYEPGQFFRPHPDFFQIDAPGWDTILKTGGQRTWTAMIFLNAPLSGGETRFNNLGFQVKPAPGRLLTWNNMDEEGAPNPYTFHEGTDVIMGRKHIVTKWFREGRWV